MLRAFRRVHKLAVGEGPLNQLQLLKRGLGLAALAALARADLVLRMGRPQDLHGLVGFLASGASSYLTSQSIVIDGGYTAL